MDLNRFMTFGLAGAVLMAFCCFTPILVGLLGLVGLGAVTGYLDSVLLPALAGLLGLAQYGLVSAKWKGHRRMWFESVPHRIQSTGRMTKP